MKRSFTTYARIAVAAIAALAFTGSEALAQCGCQVYAPVSPPPVVHHKAPVVHHHHAIVHHVKPRPVYLTPIQNECDPCSRHAYVPPVQHVYVPPAPVQNPCDPCSRHAYVPQYNQYIAPPPPAPAYHVDCSSCNRDSSHAGARCWQIPKYDDYGQAIGFKRECD